MENKSLMLTLTRMTMPPPPTPWTALAAMSMTMLTLVALSSDPTQKTDTATRRICLRPQMSDILPHAGAEAALASRYADPIHVYPMVLLNCSDIVGTATVTMVTSRAARNRAEESDSMIKMVSTLVRRSSGGVLDAAETGETGGESAGEEHSSLLIGETDLVLSPSPRRPAAASMSIGGFSTLSSNLRVAAICEKGQA